MLNQLSVSLIQLLLLCFCCFCYCCFHFCSHLLLSLLLLLLILLLFLVSRKDVQFSTVLDTQLFIFEREMSQKDRVFMANCGKTRTKQVAIGHFLVALCLCSKTSLCVNCSYANEFDLHENEPVGGTFFLLV